MSSDRRYPTLDVLRLVAISMTMLHHMRSMAERLPVIRHLSGGMWLGVDLFMLISGWLLGGQLLREAARGEVKILRFYTKRWLRTIPPYYAMLVLLYFAGSLRVGGLDGREYEIDPSRPLGLHNDLPWQTMLTHLTFLQRYIPPNLYGVSWSLCVEEHFYLCLPLIILAIMRWPRLRVVVAIVVAFEVLAVVCRFATFSGVEWSPQQTHMRCDGLFLGMLFAWIAIHRPRYWGWLGKITGWASALGVAGTAVVMATVPSQPTAWMYVLVPTIGTWTLALVFFPCVHEDSALSRINFYGLRYLGELTYSIYLVHNVLPRAWLGGHAAQAGLRGLLVRVGLVGASSVLLHHAVERPAMRLRQRLLNRWRAESTVVATVAEG